MNKPSNSASESDNRELRHYWKTIGHYYRVAACMKEVVHVDLRLVDKSDFLIVNLDPDVTSCGTLDELFLGAGQQKPTLVVCDKKRLPDWIFGRIKLEFLMNDFDEMFKYLDYVNTSSNEHFDDLGRWIFFK